MRRTLLVTTTLVFGLAGFPGVPAGGVSSSSEALTLLDDHHIIGAGWVAWRLSVPEGGGTIDWWYNATYVDAQHGHFAHWIGDGESFEGNLGWKAAWNMQRVTLPDPIGVDVVERVGSTITLDPPVFYHYWGFWPEGTYTLIMMATSDGSFVGSFPVSASEGVVVLNKTEGPEAFVIADYAFDGPYQVVKRLAGEPHRLLIHGASATVTIENAFFGVFQTHATTLTQPMVAAWTGPDNQGGATSPDPDHGAEIPLVDWAQTFTNAMPGDYEFSLVHVDQDQNQGVNRPYAWVYGADVILPR